MGGWERLDMVMRYAHLATDHLMTHAAVLDNLESFGHKMDTGFLGQQEGQRFYQSEGGSKRC